MRSGIAFVAVALSFGSLAYGQTAKTCPEQDLCYSLNIPDATAQSGNGDIYFQISAPTTYQWVALGQGSQMSGSNIFVVYTSASGQNVTVSPRLGTGHVEPQHDTAAQITVLDGSGVSNGIMTANVKCSNCNSWLGGSMDFTASSASWIYAHLSGSALNSDDLNEDISRHDAASPFDWNFASAKGGDSVNPFTTGNGSSTQSGSANTAGTSCTPAPVTQTLAQPSGSGCPTAWPTQYSTSWPSTQPTWASSCFASGHGSWPTNAPWANDHSKRQNSCDGNSGSSSSSNSNGDATFSTSNNKVPFNGNFALGNRIITAHGALASLAFVALFPIGGILIRLASFTGLIWVHALVQVVAYIIYITAFGMGIWLATQLDYFSDAHPIIGIVVFIILFAQPLTGFMHHRMFQKVATRTAWSYEHLGIGRIAIILGMINGGLGLQLAGAGTNDKIAYAVCAAVVGFVYICAIVVGESKRRRNATAALSRGPNERQLHSQGGSSESVREHFNKEGR